MINQKTETQKKIIRFLWISRGKLTRDQWAAKTGISKNMIGRYEEGETMPPIERLEIIARCAGKKVTINFEDL